jgi:hypothetical protein
MKNNYCETWLAMPGDAYELSPPKTESDWEGSSWELISFGIGPRQFIDDPSSPIWHFAAWSRRPSTNC